MFFPRLYMSVCSSNPLFFYRALLSHPSAFAGVLEHPFFLFCHFYVPAFVPPSVPVSLPVLVWARQLPKSVGSQTQPTRH